MLAAPGFEVVHNRTVFDRHHPIGEMQDKVEVLFDEKDRVAAALEFNQRVFDLPDDDRRQSLSGLVQKEASARPCAKSGRWRASAARRR